MPNIFGCCFSKKKTKHYESPVITTTVSRRSAFRNAPRIIIVGAGIAGLACGVKLIENGIDNIKILEAENRVGGRVHTVPYADGVVDLGAQWVHGEKDNVVYEMVKDLGMLATTGDVYVKFECLRSNGEIVPPEQVKRLRHILEDVFLNQRDLLDEFEGSFGKFLETQFFKALNEEEYDDIDKTIAQEFLENFKKMESTESAVGLDDVSARGFKEYWECEGDYMLNWKGRGYTEIIRILTQAQPGADMLGVLKGKVMLGEKVKQILWEQEDGCVKVICENVADAYVADNVVVTVSLGVLKKFAENMFEPSLPPQKLAAINGLGYGDVLKIFIEFPYPFWPSTWTGFVTLWREEDLEELRAKDMLWIHEILGFFPINDRPRLLEAWAIGPAVVYMESLSKTELKAHLVNLMRRFLVDWEIPEPVSILPTSWSSNDNFCGAYSFPTVYTDTVATSALALAKPVNTLINVLLDDNDGTSYDLDPARKSIRVTIKPTVLFAGEATSTHYFSTVHGAVESGWREAKRLAGYYEGQI